MLGHCTNEKCDRPLLSFAEGRLFQFEVISISVTASHESAAPFDEKPHRETAHFWLCNDCASTFTLVLEPIHGIRLVSHKERESKQQDLFRVTGDVACEEKLNLRALGQHPCEERPECEVRFT
jgi:hypothetical protein